MTPEVIADKGRARMREHRLKNRDVLLARERAYKARLPRDVLQRRTRDYNLKTKYGKGFWIAEYEPLLVAQLGGCAICGRSPDAGKPLFVDHHHKTGRVRALLCNLCNQGMAAIDALPEWLDRARGYVARHSGRG